MEINVLLKENSYDIVIGQQSLGDLGTAIRKLDLGDNAVIITNPIITQLHRRRLTSGLRKAGLTARFMVVPSGEKSKSAVTAFRLIQEIAKYSVGKRMFIIAFGGGVVGDLAGYVAAAYRRGVPYIQVPTTLLAQVDSAIGGKVGVDLPMGKNLMGAFYQPRLVWSDVDVLSTLGLRQIRNGLAEVVKYGVICDRNLFDFIQKNVGKLLGLDVRVLTEVIFQCSKIKAKIVMGDEKETKGVRTILNFGHTVGHAIEAADKFKHYQHGEAIALGMRISLEISRRRNFIKSADCERVGAVLTEIGLPQFIKKVSLSSILAHMLHDKKFKGKKNKFVLAKKIGSVKIVEGVNRKTIQAAIKTFMMP